MTNAELLAKIKAEIERRKNDKRYLVKLRQFPFALFFLDKMYGELLSFLSTLEESNSKDFPTTDEEIKQFLATHPKVELPEKYKTPDWMFEKSETPVTNDLEEAAEKYFIKVPCSEEVKKNFDRNL